ncbi:helix-turn-helix transcriptional regulator [Streptococcus suis]|uniref:DNA-binding protein n=3 Tax=Streptococcus suis TaxID=1307 RepID=A0A0Z8GN76_STRSU|nr:PAS domain-containing protein [Streptococcus suis]CYU24558.1 DNA-binding protein [Streptococcus suis]CYU44164.1 DNA-binding protein [Streptococcus suis]CYU70226.1 DNA-binding protein [Streptococcus suis]CYV01815.1 DNA-binding protein [Streptococcus suis]
MSMNSKLNHYIPLVDFLAQILGKKTEVVLQDFSQGLDHSLIYIKNNLSGRDIGAPATDFVLDVLQSKVYKEKDYLVNYRTKTLGGKELYSSSFFIKDDTGELLGMICVNADKSKMLTLKRLFESALEDVNEELANEQVEHEEPNIVENFYTTAGSMIEAAIEQETHGKDVERFKLSRTEKISVVRSLYQKGFFDFKDAIPQVATAFKMSEVSIYKYIQIIKNEANGFVDN